MTETLEEMIARLSMGKGRCPCGARPGEPCTRPSGAARLPHVGRGDLPPDMVIDPAVGPDYTGGAFTEALQASAPAPTPADDVATLRAQIRDTFDSNNAKGHDMLARLDRIAGELGGAFVRRLQADPAPAPTPADDVAALRTSLGDAYAAMPTLIGPALSILDRIAGAAPQRAFNRLGQPMSIHRPDRCGFVFAGPGWPSCSCGTPGGWQALYTLGGE